MNKREKEVMQLQLQAEEDVLHELEKQYKAALKDINDKVKLFDYDINMLNDAVNQAGIDDAAREILVSQQRSKAYQKQYQEAMKKQIEGILDKLQSDEYSTLQDYLHKCYEDSYLGTMYDLHGQGIPLIMPIDQAAAVQAIMVDSKISEGLYNSLGVDVKGLKKDIRHEITRGIASGLSYADIARNISNTSKAPLSRAKNIARTEGHRVQEQSTLDAQVKAKSKGADVLKQWDATLDGATRPVHRQLDGQIREVEEYFEAGGKKAKYPGGFGDPALDCNCRCKSLTRARWDLDEDELETLKKRAEYFGLDKTKDFEDFKKKYLKSIENLSENGKISIKKNYDSDLSQKFGKEYYNEMHNLIDSCENEDLKMVWGMFEQEIGVGDASYKGHEHFKPGLNKIYVNGSRDAKGSKWQAPYQVTFHESGHNIDYVATIKAGRDKRLPFSYDYEDNKFGKTIKAEVDAIIKKYDTELKAAFKQHEDDYEWLHDNGFMGKWEYDYWKNNGKLPYGKITYSKSHAYAKLQNEIRMLEPIEMADLSDIVEGATKGKVKCGFGHGNSYWKHESSLPVEAFAEMLDSEMANPQSIKTIKKYLPESYKVFCEMLSIMKGL